MAAAARVTSPRLDAMPRPVMTTDMPQPSVGGRSLLELGQDDVGETSLLEPHGDGFGHDVLARELLDAKQRWGVDQLLGREDDAPDLQHLVRVFEVLDLAQGDVQTVLRAQRVDDEVISRVRRAAMVDQREWQV